MKIEAFFILNIMSLKPTVFILFLVSIFQVNAQKKSTQIIDNPELKTIIIDDDAIFKMKLNSIKGKTIKLQSRIEGEYAEEMMVLNETKNDTLFISSSYLPSYIEYNDKLSVHKIQSVELSLWIPEQLTIYFKSAIASAEINGNFKHLIIELSQGNATISNFNGDATINSINGDIKLQTNNAIVKAYSKTGTITKEPLSFGENKIKLHTITGNISVTKTKK